ncbi:MAG: DUF1501 domain-containing protein [Verrucomicrobia bacterium]|nr:DUF1501 domain-containing protein [Verrucomicrobiota bacterium]
MDHDDHHESDHELPSGALSTRREFLRTTLLGAAAAWTLPAFLDKTFFALGAQAAENSATQTITGKDAPILVVLQQAGGNDGLNTLVPFADDAYHRVRPAIGFAADKVLKLNDYCGLNPQLTALRGLYDEGHLAVVQGVGYPNPNRSHFRSTEIWQTASDSNRFASHGWLGNYFDSCCQGADPTVGVAIGGQMPQAFTASTPVGVSFANPEQYRWIDREKPRGSMSAAEFYYRMLNQPEEDSGAMTSPGSGTTSTRHGANPVNPDFTGGSIASISGPANGAGGNMSSVDFLERTALDAQLSSDRVLQIARTTRPLVPYPPGRLSDSLSLVGRMIAGGLPTRVFYVSHGGYDTHQGQQGTHQRLMTEFNGALGAFCADLKAQGNFNRVIIMTFSEFGRRVAQNASGGTDHGAAAPMFLLGGGLKGGFYGNYPSLTQLFQGDLMHNVDFRSVYATLLERWLRVPSEKVLGRKFSTLPLV